MKNHPKPKSHIIRRSRAIVVGLAVICSSGAIMAQEYTNIMQSFDDVSSVSSMGSPGGSSTVAPYTLLDWNATEGNPDGCLWAQIPWLPTGGGWQEIQISYDLSPWFGLTLAPYATIEYDVKVQGAPAPGTDGNFGNVQIVLQGWNDNGANGNPSPISWAPAGQVPIIASNTWQHITHKLTQYEPYNLNRMVINFVAPNCTNTISYLVDNLVITVPTNPPPALAMTEPPPGGGLHLVTAGGATDRQNIKTVGTNFTWYGASGPVTYSFTVGQYPSTTTYHDYQTHLILVPNPPTTTFPDWTGANVIRMDIGNDGAQLRFKTNAANANGGLYTPVAEGGGAYPAVPSSTMLGTWSLTFNNNTSVTVKTPDGTSSNYVFDAAADFNANNFRVYIGAQYNNPTNLGQEVIITGASITGAGGGLSDNFSAGALDTNKWQISAAQPANVYVLSPTIKYKVSWPLPDNLFKLISSPDLANMTNSSLSTVALLSTRSAYVPQGYPGAGMGYFGLAKRAYTKLQVLMPGETTAPGTTAGKVGTPINQKAGVGYKVQINAVDDKWNPAFTTHEVYLETQPTNGFKFVWRPQLVLGSYSYTVTNATAGTFKIHVLDNADNTKTGDGSSYTVDP